MKDNAEQIVGGVRVRHPVKPWEMLDELEKYVATLERLGVSGSRQGYIWTLRNILSRYARLKRTPGTRRERRALHAKIERYTKLAGIDFELLRRP